MITGRRWAMSFRLARQPWSSQGVVFGPIVGLAFVL
jgi:hypothetical protein